MRTERQLIHSCNPDVSVGGGAGGDSPRPKKKSEIRSLLDATGGTTATADNNKPQWMMFRAQVDRCRYRYSILDTYIDTLYLNSIYLYIYTAFCYRTTWALLQPLVELTTRHLRGKTGQLTSLVV